MKNCFNCKHYLGEARQCKKYRYIFSWFVAGVSKCAKWEIKERIE